MLTRLKINCVSIGHAWDHVWIDIRASLDDRATKQIVSKVFEETIGQIYYPIRHSACVPTNWPVSDQLKEDIELNGENADETNHVGPRSSDQGFEPSFT